MMHEYKSMTNKPHSRWNRVMLHHAAIASLIQFALHLAQISDFIIGKSSLHHNRASSKPYSWCDIGGCSSFTNFSPHIDPPIRAKNFQFWFVNPKDFIPLLYYPVFVCLGPLESFDFILLPQQWFLDSNSAILASFKVFSQWMSFFSLHWFSCAMVFGAVSLLSCKLVTLMKLSSKLVKQVVSSKQ